MTFAEGDSTSTGISATLCQFFKTSFHTHKNQVNCFFQITIQEIHKTNYISLFSSLRYAQHIHVYNKEPVPAQHLFRVWLLPMPVLSVLQCRHYRPNWHQHWLLPGSSVCCSKVITVEQIVAFNDACSEALTVFVYLYICIVLLVYGI